MTGALGCSFPTQRPTPKRRKNTMKIEVASLKPTDIVSLRYGGSKMVKKMGKMNIGKGNDMANF